MRLIIFALARVIWPHIAASADPLIGQRLFMKEGVNAKIENTFVDRMTIPFPATVGEVEGEWLWLERAWVRKSDTMPPQVALNHFTEEIRKFPLSLSGWASRGAVWDELGQRNAAIGDYTEAIRLNPLDSTSYYNRAISRKANGELDLAISDFCQAISLMPRYSAAYCGRGATELQKGQIDAALKDLNQAVALESNNLYNFYSRGIVWLEKRDLDNALNDFTESIKLNKKFGLAYGHRANFWQMKCNFDRAIDDYTTAIKLVPDPAILFVYRGLAFRHKGESDKALADYDAAVKLSPQNPEAYNAIAWHAATNPEKQSLHDTNAVWYAIRACELSEWRTWYCVGTLAAAYADSGDFANATRWASKSVELAPEAERFRASERLELYRMGKPYRVKPDNGPLNI